MQRTKPLVLFFPFDLLSHYLRCIELADAIKDDCTVLFAGSSKYNEYVYKHGYEVFRCAGYDASEMVSYASRFDFSWISITSIEPIFLDQVHCIKTLRPDIVIGDGVNTLKMAAEYTGTRYWALMNGYMTRNYSLLRDLPSAHKLATFLKPLPSPLYSGLIRFGENLALRKLHKPFSELRSKYGLKQMHFFLDEMEGDHNFILDLPELFPQKKLPANYHLVGAVYYTGNHDKISHGVPAVKPVIVVSMGSSGNWHKISLLNDPAFSCYDILAAGDHERVLDARHISHFPFISEDVLDNADLVICHGGNGTVYQALAHGIPVLCLPGLFEQEYNVRRIEALKLGMDISKIKEPGKLREAAMHWTMRKRSGTFNKLAQKINVNSSKEIFRKTFLDIISGNSVPEARS